MSFEWTRVLSWLKPKPSHLFAVALVTALLLFGPDGLLAYLGVRDLVQAHRPWVGAALLLSAALLVSQGAAWLLTSPGSPANEWWTVRRLSRHLRELSPGEKAVLRQYMDEETKTLNFAINDGVIRGLESKRIVRQASNVSYSLMFSYNLQPWVWRYLRRNPHILK